MHNWHRYPVSAYKGPDLRCSFRSLWSNQGRGSREFPSDSVGLALLDGPPWRRPDGRRRLLLAADPDGRGTQSWPGSWNSEAAPESWVTAAAPTLEHLHVGRGEGDGGRHGLTATSTPIRWIPQTWSAIGNYLIFKCCIIRLKFGILMRTVGGAVGLNWEVGIGSGNSQRKPNQGIDAVQSRLPNLGEEEDAEEEMAAGLPGRWRRRWGGRRRSSTRGISEKAANPVASVCRWRRPP